MDPKSKPPATPSAQELDMDRKIKEYLDHTVQDLGCAELTPEQIEAADRLVIDSLDS